MKSLVWIGAVAGAVVIGALALLVWHPHTSSSSVKPTPSHAARIRSCTGRDFALTAGLRLARDKTHVLVRFEAAGRGHICRVRGAGIPIAVHAFDEHGPVQIRAASFSTLPVSIQPDAGKGSGFDTDTETVTMNPSRKAWCASGGQTYSIVVTAPEAHPAKATAKLCR